MARFLSATLLLALGATAVGCSWIPRGFVRSDHDALPSRIVEGSPMYVVTPPGSIPALDAPDFVGAEEAAREHEPAEPVLVVGAGGELRAYSLWMLEAHEVVNDRLGEVPIAVTY